MSQFGSNQNEERTSMGELANWEPPPDEASAYAALIKMMDEIYPEDWRLWVVNRTVYEDLFGNKISSDEECRLRFAIPTVQLAYTFASEAPTSLSERKYKAIKRKLINWPIGRALIYAPLSTMKKIHPTDVYNRFYEFLHTIKPQLISQTEASQLLKSRKGQVSTSPSTSPSTQRERRHCPDSNPAVDRVECFMKQQTEILQQLLQAVGKTAQQNSPVGEREFSDSEDDSWAAPPIFEENIGAACSPTPDRISSETQHVEEQHFYNFYPETKESEAKIGEADDTLAKQGTQIQRLGSTKWQNIRYAEVQKHFQATPVFTSLQVNSNLASATPAWQTIGLLEKMDQCLGAITHGLLQQRQCFMETYKDASLEVKSHISKNFLAPECHFRKTSDALLQYTCGKRAEIIQQMSWHSNRKELWAVLETLRKTVTQIKHQTVMVQSDNRSVVAYINKEGGTRSPKLLGITEEILQLTKRHQINLIARYLPGRYNTTSDSLSRAASLPEWTLSSSILSNIFRKWGTPTIDLFASAQSAIVSNYVSEDARDHNCLFVDAFSRPWHFKLGWIFPPPGLIPRVLQHLKKSSGIYLLVTPQWERTFWKTEVKQRALGPAFRIPNLHKNLVDLRTGRPPPEIKDLRLQVWRVRAGLV